MSAFNRFNCFSRDLGRKVHNLHADTLKIMLSNVAPVAGNQVKADITEIAAGNGYIAGGVQVPNNSYDILAGAQSALAGDDAVLTAAGGSIGPYRYAVLYNDSALNDELIGWWDHGSNQTLADGEAVTLNLDQVNKIIKVG